MTFNAPSFFAGVATVLLTIAVGFGGGVFMSDWLFGNTPRTPNRVERQATATPVPDRSPVPPVIASAVRESSDPQNVGSAKIEAPPSNALSGAQTVQSPPPHSGEPSQPAHKVGEPEVNSSAPSAQEKRQLKRQERSKRREAVRRERGERRKQVASQDRPAVRRSWEDDRESVISSVRRASGSLEFGGADDP